MDEPVPAQIVGPFQRTFALQELGRTKRGQGFGEERICVKPRVVPMSQADGKIDPVALEVCQRHRGRYPQVDVGVLVIERRQPREQPF